jgi:glycosyltransferase involved in cell wall biosynthesis
MKIVINALSGRIGGGRTYLEHLLSNLVAREGLSVHVFAPRGLILPSPPDIVRVETGWPTDNPLLRTLWEIFRLPGYLKKEEANVLFCPGGVVTTRVPAGCKIVTMFRNMMPFDAGVVRAMPLGLQRLRNVMLRPILLWSLARADLVIFVSNFGKSVIMKLTSIKAPCVIHHGISEEFRTFGKELPRPAGIDKNAKYFLYVSRFSQYKNHMTVVSAYSKLPEVFRNTYKMIFAGQRDGVEADQVSAFVEAAGLNDNVAMLGEVPHASLPALYHHSELILFASSCENCPNILLEALGAGRPVLSSNVMPMPEIGGNAVEYFSPFDSDDLLRAMLRVLNDKNYAEELAAAAGTRSKCFDSRSSARDTWDRILALGASQV